MERIGINDWAVANATKENSAVLQGKCRRCNEERYAIISNDERQPVRCLRCFDYLTTTHYATLAMPCIVKMSRTSPRIIQEKPFANIEIALRFIKRHVVGNNRISVVSIMFDETKPDGTGEVLWTSREDSEEASRRENNGIYTPEMSPATQAYLELLRTLDTAVPTERSERHVTITVDDFLAED